MGIIRFLKDSLCLTGFSFVCLCVFLVLILIAFMFLIIGILTHESYKNNKVCFYSCHVFITIMQIAWLVLMITLCVELVSVLVYSVMHEIPAMEFIIRFFVTFSLIAGAANFAGRMYKTGGVGYVSPYEKLTRFAKPCFWEQDP